MDFEVGRILDGLDSLGLTSNTAVILHADHGYVCVVRLTVQLYN